MESTVRVDNFEASLGCLLAPIRNKLATQFFSTGLSADEQKIVLDRTYELVASVLHGKLTRLLLLELHASREAGRLTGSDSRQRWDSFLEISSRPEFWEAINDHYPSLSRRVSLIVENRCAASLLFAKRWASDRHRLMSILDVPSPQLKDVTFGAGDSHQGGFTVAIVHCDGGSVVYKPRSLLIDGALHQFTMELGGAIGRPLGFRVPRVVCGSGYGWSEFIEHRYAENERALQNFYTGIGECLAVMHLLGASDIHAENLIAHGGTPVVIDCETMFTPQASLPPSGCGEALDHALRLISDGVLGIGLLPGRAQGLGWRGVDYSGIGNLPNQQPMMRLPTILDAGTDKARFGMMAIAAPVAQNHPSSEPALAEHWPSTLRAFEEVSEALITLDGSGKLEPLLEIFSDCRVRVVLRPTEAYAEIGRMLWHPVSLHNQAPARARAYHLLEKMAINTSAAPSEAVIINSEIDDLLVGDFPIFSAVVSDGRIEGPRGTQWRSFGNLIHLTLNRWRGSDFRFEKQVMRAAMVSAFLNDGWTSRSHQLVPKSVRRSDLDLRRKTLLSSLMRELVDAAILGKDGTATWVSPTYGQTGWSVSPSGLDLYGGLSGIALLGVAYLREVNAGRADPVDEVEEAVAAALRSLEIAEQKAFDPAAWDGASRPPPVGGFVGLGSQIWTLLTIAKLGGGCGNELERAKVIARHIPNAIKSDDVHDVLTGGAGAIPALLMLSAQTNDDCYLNIARLVGDRLCMHAQYSGDSAYWVHSELWPNGLGGFSHGATGIGWALDKLAKATNEQKYAQIADAAFRFEESIFDTQEGNWIDLRFADNGGGGSSTSALWCHGAVGIGLAHLDLDPTLQRPRSRMNVERAVLATERQGFGYNHCICHGDFGSWELLDRAMSHGLDVPNYSRESLCSRLLTSLEDYGPLYGAAKEVYAPGLLPGAGGIAYQLLRMNAASCLPSVLTLDS